MTLHPDTIGIDIAKDHLDVFDRRRGGVRRVLNNPAHAARLAEEWKGRGCLVVLEATGRYDAALRQALDAAGVAHARINPEQARSFAKALGKRAKTDPLDARMLAELGARLTPRAAARPDPERAELARLNARRDQLVGMRQMERARRSECDHERSRASLEAHLAWLDSAIAEMNEAIAGLMRKSSSLQAAEKRLRSVPGVGPVTAAILIAAMPELGSCSPKTVAALGGLAPWNNDTGRFQGRRSVRGGRRRVREALYMAAVSASRTRTRLGAFYRSLRTAGKAPKCAFIALARKMLVILNAIERDKTAFKTS